MAKGRKTGGRQKGAKNKATIEREALQASAIELAKTSGISPLEVMLTAMRAAYDKNDMDGAVRYAKEAAPYVHPRCASIEVKNPDGESLNFGTDPRVLATAIMSVLREARLANGVVH